MARRSHAVRSPRLATRTCVGRSVKPPGTTVTALALQGAFANARRTSLRRSSISPGRRKNVCMGATAGCSKRQVQAEGGDRGGTRTARLHLGHRCACGKDGRFKERRVTVKQDYKGHAEAMQSAPEGDSRENPRPSHAIGRAQTRDNSARRLRPDHRLCGGLCSTHESQDDLPSIHASRALSARLQRSETETETCGEGHVCANSDRSFHGREVGDRESWGRCRPSAFSRGRSAADPASRPTVPDRARTGR